MTYQNFGDADGAGDSDSQGKLRRLELPRDLTGCSVLDVACNEGFFCQEAWRRGAARVVGIDRNGEFLARARQRDPKTEYREMDYFEVLTLDEQFDVIFLLSALHYALDGRKLLVDIVNMLTPDGLLVLECGVAPGRKPDWVEVERPIGDVVRHPTHAMLMKSLRQAAVRRIGPSVDQAGDPIPRQVYHARPRKPIVLLVSGPSGSGKSTLLETMSFADNLIPMNLDALLVEMPAWCQDDALLALREAGRFKTDQLNELVDHLVNAGAEDAFVEQVIASHRIFPPKGEPAITVIEGYALSQGNFQASFKKRLRERGCYVWQVEPAGAPAGTNSVLNSDQPYQLAPALDPFRKRRV